MESHQVTVKVSAPQTIAVGMADAARLIGVSRMHIYRRLIPGGDLRTFMLGGRRLVTYAELERFIAESEAAA